MLARRADASGVADCASVVAACRTPVGVALGASVVVAAHAVDLVVVTPTVVITAIFAVGDVVTRKITAVLSVDGTLEVGHGSEAATGVVDFFPGAVGELLFESEASDDETILDFLLEQVVGTEDVAGRVFPAQLVGVGAFPLHGGVNLGVDEADGGRGENTVTLGDGAVHGLLLCVVRNGHEWSW